MQGTRVPLGRAYARDDTAHQLVILVIRDLYRNLRLRMERWGRRVI